MKSFTLSLAMIASAAYAVDIQQYGHGHGGYGYGGSPGYGHGHSHGHGHSLGYHGYGASAANSHVNPWFDSTDTTNASSNQDTTGWWSPYKQYRPPLIPYRPNHFHQNQYGKCDI